MPSPRCTINGSAQEGGVDVPGGAATITIAVDDPTGVKEWALTCVGTDELNSSSTVTASLTINTVTKRATFLAPSGNGFAGRFKSVVNNGLDANGKPDASLTTYFEVFVLTSSGRRLIATNQTTEGSASFGWTTDFNSLLRSSMPGASGLISLNYGANVATDASLGNIFQISIVNGSAFQIDNPTNGKQGQQVTYDLQNNTAGAHGAITWGANFKLAGALAAIAAGKRKTISFYCEGAYWIERSRAAADI